MTTIVYVQPNSDFRELSKADVEKYLDEDSEAGSKLRFENGVPQEVDDSVAEVLLNHEHFDGEFAEITDEPETEADLAEAGNKAASKAAKKAAKKAASSSVPDSPNASSETTGDTGRGTSTGGSST